MRLRTSLITLIALGAVVASALWAGQRRWNGATSEFKARLGATAKPARVPVYSEQELDGLPVPVARYLRQVLRDGQPTIRRARIEWRGEFNLGQPGANRWKPLKATQDYVVDPPGFVWDARIAMAPVIPVLVRDMFLAGQGSMHGKIAGLITVVDAARTPQWSTAALQRHLGEALWSPTALLPSQGVRWEPIDESRSRATLSAGGVTASVEFHFGADGLVDATMVADRLFDSGKSPPVQRPWRARVLGWREFDGMKLPAQAVAEWVLDSGVYAYWRGLPVTVIPGGASMSWRLTPNLGLAIVAVPEFFVRLRLTPVAEDAPSAKARNEIHLQPIALEAPGCSLTGEQDQEATRATSIWWPAPSLMIDRRSAADLLFQASAALLGGLVDHFGDHLLPGLGRADARRRKWRAALHQRQRAILARGLDFGNRVGAGLGALPVVGVKGEARLPRGGVIEGTGLRQDRQRQGGRDERQNGMFANVHSLDSLKKKLPSTPCRGMPDGMTMTLRTGLQHEPVQQMTSWSSAPGTHLRNRST